MNILVVEPGKAPFETAIEGTLREMQRIVGGDIETVCPFDDPVILVCNEEGKINGLPLNRAIDGGDIIAGTFFVCGQYDGDLASLPPELAQKYKERFKDINEFRTVNTPLYEVVFHKMKVSDQPDTPHTGTPRPPKQPRPSRANRER